MIGSTITLTEIANKDLFIWEIIF